MATWFAVNSSVNIDSANEWNSQADGLGSFLTWASLGAGDTLHANGKTAIAINVSFTCLQIDTASTGGGFTCNTAVTITANIVAGTTNCLACSNAGATTVAIVGNLSGGATATTSAVVFSSTGTINITGNVTGGTGTNSFGMSITSTGTVNITGNVTGGTGGASRAGINSTTACTVAITGNVASGTGASAGPGLSLTSTTVTCTVTGNVTADGGPAIAIGAGGSGFVTVNSGNIVYVAGSNAITGGCKYNPGAGNYIQVPKTSGTANYYQSGNLVGQSRLVRS